MLKQGTFELLFLGLCFVILQFWWIRLTIKKGRTMDVDKWGQWSTQKKEDQMEITKKRLEKIFRS